MTTKRARSASCCATCLLSTAFVNSVPKDRWVMATSSTRMLNSVARFIRLSRTAADTWSRCRQGKGGCRGEAAEGGILNSLVGGQHVLLPALEPTPSQSAIGGPAAR